MRDGYEHDKQMRYVNCGLFNGQRDLKINYRGNTLMRLLKTLIARRNVAAAAAAAAIAALNASADRAPRYLARKRIPPTRIPRRNYAQIGEGSRTHARACEQVHVHAYTKVALFSLVEISYETFRAIPSLTRRSDGSEVRRES